MRIRRVQFQNYRCFLDDEVILPDIDAKENSNINLFIAPNGGGKTEFLFSIWWALYPSSFSFSDLKGKEATNYSLNSDLYFQLKQGPVGGKRECFVEVEIENEGTTYIVRRTETFQKKATKIVSQRSCLFYQINKNGETSPPINDPKQVNNQLERILPQKVLSGIIFDGERMKKISSIDEESVKSIEGVIADITNKEVLATFDSELRTLKNFYQKRIRVLARKSNESDLEMISSEIAQYEEELQKNKSNIANLNVLIPEFEEELLKVSEELKALEESKQIESELRIAERDLIHYEENYDKSLTTFRSQMSKLGPTILIKKLTTDLENAIKNSDVPMGLNVNIVNNILEKDSCICGTPFNHVMRSNLNDLKLMLPPNDINATIKNQIKNVLNNSTKSISTLKELYKSMDENYENINKTTEEIARLKTLLTESVEDRVKKLGIKRAEIETKINQLKKEKVDCLNAIDEISNKLKKLEEAQKKLAESKSEIQILQARKDFTDKCIKAIEEIQEKYRMIALEEINELFGKAYQSLSEDYTSGRRVYLTHRLSKKYMMLTYNENDLIKYLSDVMGYSHDDIINGQIDKDELEQAIDTIKVSNSTGQQTVMSLAFVKAILDYSRKNSDERDKDLKKVKSYPVVIDAPFSDLSGENLSNSAKNLNNFSEQVLLLINHSSYENIKDSISEGINSLYYFHKDSESQSSYIEKGAI